MKFFTKDQLIADDDVPYEGSWVGGRILQTLASRRYRTMPKLLHVGVHDGENDCSLYEVLLELAPGLVIATRCGLPEDLASDMTDEELKAVETEVQDSVVEYADRAVQACMLQLDRLADILHQARLDARGVLAEWNRGGVQARLVDVRLAPFDHWRGVTEPALVILLEAPGERLTPETVEVQVETADRIVAELSDIRNAIADRCARSAELMAKGATGTISRLALNAIDSFGDREATLRKFAAKWLFWLPDDTALLMRSGDVQAGNGLADEPIDWLSGKICVDACLVDGGRLGTAVGRPVTELVDHEFLSDDMIVTGVSSDLDEGRIRITIWLDMPQLLFCSISGRVWTREDAETINRVSDVVDRGNVVPFRRRTG